MNSNEEVFTSIIDYCVTNSLQHNFDYQMFDNPNETVMTVCVAN